jgi:hypothetical protein
MKIYKPTIINSLEYFGYAKLDCLAFWYVCEHYKNGDGYSVFDTDGLSLFGFVSNKSNTVHLLQIKENLR